MTNKLLHVAITRCWKYSKLQRYIINESIMVALTTDRKRVIDTQRKMEKIFSYITHITYKHHMFIIKKVIMNRFKIN